MANVYGDGSWSTAKINGVEYVTFTKRYPILKTPKKFYGKTKKEVKAKRDKFEAETHQLKPSEIKDILFGDYISLWFKNVRINEDISESTYDRQEYTFNSQILPYDIATTCLKDIDSDVINSHLKILTEKYSKSTIDKAIFLLNQVCRYAEKQNDIVPNPMNNVDRIKEKDVAIKEKDHTFLTLDEVDLLFTESNRVNTHEYFVRGKIGERVYGNNAYMIILIVYTGMRIGEARALKWQDILLEEKLIYVDESASMIKNRDEATKKEKAYVEKLKDPKTKAGIRYVPMTDRCEWVLNELKKQNPNYLPDDYIFPSSSSSKKITKSNINRTLKNIQLRAGIVDSEGNPKCTVHGLRHTYGSFLINDDEKALPVVSSILGHASVSTTAEIYVHILNKKKIQSVQILNNTHKAPKEKDEK